MKSFVFLVLMLGFVCSVRAQYVVKSPNDSVCAVLNVKRIKKYGHYNRIPDRMTMSVSVNGKMRVERREIGLTVLCGGRRIRFGRCEMQTVANLPARADSKDDAELMARGLTGEHNTLVLTAKEGIVLQVRAYNNGVAYRFMTKKQTDMYKVLDVLKVFPDDVPMADLGTYNSDLVLPWCVYSADRERAASDGVASGTLGSAEQMDGYKRTKFVSWRDALTTVMIGVDGHKYAGGAWRDVALDASPSVSLTYKHLYTSVEFATCHQLMYINMGESYYPFCDTPKPMDFHTNPENGVIGPIHSWNIGAHLGYRLPIQSGYTVWGLTPYVGTSLTHLTQHNDTKHPFFGSLNHHDHVAVGPGFLLQINMPGRAAIGLSYDCQFYTDSKAPNCRHSLGISFGMQL